MKHINAVHEQVSALVDGHLQGEEFAQWVGRIETDEELRVTWQTYHLVGDVLRSGVHVPCSDTSAFLSRFQNRLSAEPPFRSLATAPEAKPVPRLRAEAAHEPVFRGKLVAGFASLAAVAAIGWNLAGIEGAHSAGAQLARTQAAPAAVVTTANAAQPVAQALVPVRVLGGNSGPQVMLRDPRLDQLLEAHRQVSGASQLPSGFLRNATFERP
jgi:sigma-E factor negative regulatory protein RseA